MKGAQEWTTSAGKRVSVHVVKSPLEMAWVAAGIYQEAWSARSGDPFVVGLPTGGTPVPLYSVLTGLFLEGVLDFENVHTFNLDEYMDIPPGHPQSYRSYMEDRFFRFVNISKRNIRFLNGLTRDWRTTCRRYEERIRALGGIDLQFLGIGMNGHIAFNEPGTERASRTRMVRLSEGTLRANSSVFPDPKEAPRFALTMGISTILDAREIVLLATGAGKANAVYESLCEPPDVRVPASFLQTFPGRCVYVLDGPAAAELPVPPR